MNLIDKNIKNKFNFFHQIDSQFDDSFTTSHISKDTQKYINKVGEIDKFSYSNYETIDESKSNKTQADHIKIMKNSKKQDKNTGKDFKFKPSLCEKSREIVEKMMIENRKGLIYEKGIKNKSKNKQNKTLIFSTTNHKKSFEYFSRLNQATKSKSPSNLKAITNLYERGVRQIEKKQENIKKSHEKIRKSEVEEKKNYFKPRINVKSKEMIEKKGNSSLSPDMNISKFEIRNEYYYKMKKNENIKRIEKYDEMRFKEKYTFSPNLNKPVLKEDVSIIMNNIDAINKYVSKRHLSIQNERNKKEENEKSTRYFLVYPKEKSFVSPSHSKKQKQSDFHRRSNSKSRNINEKRRELNIQDFYTYDNLNHFQKKNENSIYSEDFPEKFPTFHKKYKN